MTKEVANLIFNRKKRLGLLCVWHPPVDRAKLDPIVRMEMDRIVPKIMQIFDRDDAFFKEIRKK